MNPKDIRQHRKLTIVLCVLIGFFCLFNFWTALSEARGDFTKILYLILAPIIGFAIGWIFLQGLLYLDRAIKKATLPKYFTWIKSTSSAFTSLGLITALALLAIFRNQGWYENMVDNTPVPLGAGTFLLALLIATIIRYNGLLKHSSAK